MGWRGCTNTGLEINKNSAGNIMVVVCLVEKDILTVSTLRRPVLEDPLLAYAMLSAEALPECGADWSRVSRGESDSENIP